MSSSRLRLFVTPLPLHRVLDIHDNQLIGDLPEPLYSLSALTSLDVSQNNLTASLSNSLGHLTNLT